MSISDKYFTYLDHFKRAITLGELASGQGNAIGLRHDVDHDLDLALDMAWHENKRGFRATYFVLPTASYWQDADLSEKLLQIKDYGHEVGLHLNILAQWRQGMVTDVQQGIQDQVSYIRNLGIPLVGVAAHGDQDCYANNFINYWCFRELKPADPAKSESYLSAEGVPDKKRYVIYPENHSLQNHLGEKFSFWSVPMEDLGLKYHATHIKTDGYFSDSGGGWSRTADPISKDLSGGRHQVLIHPEHWRAPQRTIFVLSTARSGSKWLSEVVNRSSSVISRHEFTLNHDFKSGTLTENKRTADHFVELVEDKEKALGLILNMRDWIESQTIDFCETNVYLERFLEELKTVYPSAALVHLHRRPSDVVKSIMNRGWYDTPEDSRHPRFEVDDWEAMDPFEKCCIYVAETNRNLEALEKKICFEKMVSDRFYLIEKFEKLGILIHPRLLNLCYEQVINANKKTEFPGVKGWTDKQFAVYQKYCFRIEKNLGYSESDWGERKKRHFSWLSSFITKCKLTRKRLSHLLLEGRSWIGAVDYSQYPDAVTGSCEVKQEPSGVSAVPLVAKHSYVMLKKGDWSRLPVSRGGKAEQYEKPGWPASIYFYYRGELHVEVTEGDQCQLFALFYDKDGKLTGKKSLGVIRDDKPQFKFSFKVNDTKVSRFNLGLYFSQGKTKNPVGVKKLGLQRRSV